MNLVAADVSPLHLKLQNSQSRLTSAATVQGFKARFHWGILSLVEAEEQARLQLRRNERSTRIGFRWHLWLAEVLSVLNQRVDCLPSVLSGVIQALKSQPSRNRLHQGD